MSFGDIFCVRVAGNIVNNDVLASVEYACKVVGVKLILVLGHSRCGAIQSACDGVKMGHITQLLEKIQPAVTAECTIHENRTSQNVPFVNHVTQLNVANTLKNMYQQSDILKELIDTNEIGIAGAVYDVQSGIVKFKDYAYELSQLEGDEKHVLGRKLEQILKEAKID
jgi:carbonic anhydrase